jgi:hypothetical protein
MPILRLPLLARGVGLPILRRPLLARGVGLPILHLPLQLPLGRTVAFLGETNLKQKRRKKRIDKTNHHRLIIMDSPTDLRPESMEQHGSMRTLMQGATTAQPRSHAGQVLPSTMPGGWSHTSRAWTTGPVTTGSVRTQKEYSAHTEVGALMQRVEVLEHARPGVSRRELHELETRFKEQLTDMKNEIRYLRALYDALNVRVHATPLQPPQPPAPPPPARTTRDPFTLRMGAESSDRSRRRVSPTLEVTLPDDLLSEAETRALLESLAQNM